MSRVFSTISVIFISLFMGASLYSQGAGSEPGKESREELNQKNNGTYLEKSQYRNISFVFKDKLLEDMRALHVIVENFGDEVEGSRAGLEKIQKDYQNAVRYHYRRAYILSGKLFLDIYKESDELFKKFALLYEKQSEELITQCADELTKLHMESIAKETSNPRESRSRDIEEANFKLKIAYYQMSQGDEMIKDKRYSDSLVHFRLAKDFTLKVLSDLELDEAKRKEKLNPYGKHLADNRNRVFKKE